MKEQILSVKFNRAPQVRCRVQNKADKFKTIISKDNKKRTLWNNKAEFPFKLDNDVIVIIETTKRRICYKIDSGYTWNGADIPRFVWRIVGSQYDPTFLIASMVHDLLIEKRHYILEETLQNTVTLKEYRRLTSLIFRQLLKDYGTKTLKANIMAWAVQTWQTTGARRQWKR